MEHASRSRFRCSNLLLNLIFAPSACKIKQGTVMSGRDKGAGWVDENVPDTGGWLLRVERPDNLKAGVANPTFLACERQGIRASDNFKSLLRGHFHQAGKGPQGWT